VKCVGVALGFLMMLGALASVSGASASVEGLSPADPNIAVPYPMLKRIVIEITEEFIDSVSGKPMEGRPKLPFRSDAETVITLAGRVVVAPTENPQAILKIVVRGIALGAAYSLPRGPTRLLYTGAKLSGTISLEVDGKCICQKNFAAEWPMPIGTGGGSPNPIGAPWSNVYHCGNRFSEDSSYETMIWLVVGESLGKQGLYCALETDPYKREQLLAAVALGRMGGKDAIPPLVAALRRSECTASVPWALGEIGDPSIAQPLADFLAGQKWGTSTTQLAAEQLSKLGDTGSTLLVELISDERYRSRGWRSQLIRPLGHCRASRAEECLIRVVMEEPDNRYSAAEALQTFPTRRSVDALVTALEDKTYTALKSLRSITGQDFGWDQTAWRKWLRNDGYKMLKESMPSHER